MRTPSSLGSAATSLLALFALATSPAAVAAARIVTASITLSIPASQHIPNPSAHLPPSTHATLTTLGGSGGRKPLSAPLTVANTFVFDNVTLGSYLADVHCPIYGFSPLRVDVGAFEDGFRVQVWETYRGNDWENKGEAVPAKQLPGAAPGKVVYEVRVFGRKVFFQDRASCEFSFLSFYFLPLALNVTLGRRARAGGLYSRPDIQVLPHYETATLTPLELLPQNSLYWQHPQEPHDPHGYRQSRHVHRRTKAD